MTLPIRAIGPIVAILAAALCAESSSSQADSPSVSLTTATAATTPVMRPVPAAEAALPSTAPYLDRVLPADALGYLRVPSLWGLLGTPKGGIYDRALGSEAHVAAVSGIRAGLGENLLPELAAENRALFALLLLHLRSPIEAALLPPATAGRSAELLITAALDFPDPSAFNAFVLDASGRLPMLQLASPLDAQGDGVLAVAGLPVPVHYSSAEGRVFLLAGEAKDPAVLARRLGGLSPAGEHALAAVESRLESGGQGAFLWLDMPRTLAFLKASGLVDVAAMLTAFGAGEVRSFGLGAGSSGGIHRIKLLLEMPRVGLRSFVPAVRTRVEVQAAGVPRALVQLGLPAPEDLVSLEQGLRATLPEAPFQAYLEWKTAVKEGLGLTLEDLLGTFGQDISLLFDEAGSYLALRLRNAARFDALLGQLAERFEVRHETREIAGRTIHHLVVPSGANRLPAAAAGGEPSALERRLTSLPTHVYFVTEGDYLLLAGMPQPLIDREYITERTPVHQWIEQRQRLDPEGALLLATTRTAGVPGALYDLHLQFLTVLGDLAGRPVDLFALPTARELALPAAGAYGLRVAATESELSVELAFEHNPAELLMGDGGYTGIIVAGILAGIAIPAYQDYVVRVQVAGAIEATEPLRNFLAEFSATNGRFPNDDELQPLDLSQLEQPHFQLAVQPQEGAIRVTFALDALGEANTVVLSPQIAEGGVLWRCASTMASKYLPATCR